MSAAEQQARELARALAKSPAAVLHAYGEAMDRVTELRAELALVTVDRDNAVAALADVDRRLHEGGFDYPLGPAGVTSALQCGKGWLQWAKEERQLKDNAVERIEAALALCDETGDEYMLEAGLIRAALGEAASP